ncbi:hypothetical protein M8J75_004677 [Diaphorina citri]|nr:hypothetical protein M8J75_004677 [Diaphorina citri]
MNCMIVLPRGNTLPPEKKPWLKSRLQTLLQSFEVVPESVDSAVYPECDASSMAIQNPRTRPPGLPQARRMHYAMELMTDSSWKGCS